MNDNEIVETMNADPNREGTAGGTNTGKARFYRQERSAPGDSGELPVERKGLHVCVPGDLGQGSSTSSQSAGALTVDETTFPPWAFMARGTSSIEIVQGIPQEYIDASRRIVGDDLMPSWEAEVRSKMHEMALITITPTWLKVVDFESRFPGPS